MLTSLTSPSPVYRLRATETTNARGDVVRDWNTPARERIRRAQVQADANSATERGGAITLSTARTLLITGRYDLTAEDRIEYLGHVYTLDGEPETVPLLVGGVHTEARLKAVEVR